MYIPGTPGNDTLNGTAGDDLIVSSNGFDYVFAGDGNDTLEGGADSDWLFGQDGDDVLWGFAGNDYLNGGDGNDWIVVHTGHDTVLGGGGGDTLEFKSTDSYGWTIDLSTHEATHVSGWEFRPDLSAPSGWAFDITYDTVEFSSIDEVVDSNRNDQILGSAGTDRIFLLGGGDDIVDAGGGDDLVDVEKGDNQISTGAGVDHVTLHGFDSWNWVDLGTDDDFFQIRFNSANPNGSGFDLITGSGSDLINITDEFRLDVNPFQVPPLPPIFDDPTQEPPYFLGVVRDFAPEEGDSFLIAQYGAEGGRLSSAYDPDFAGREVIYYQIAPDQWRIEADVDRDDATDWYIDVFMADAEIAITDDDIFVF